MVKTGLFGGTFNPIHLGHVQLAEAAQRACDLDTILFIPAAEPPHKEVSTILSYAHRSQMVELALADSDVFVLSTIESELPYPSYSIDTLIALEQLWEGEEREAFFLIGYDAFIEIKTWKDYDILLSKISFILCPRVGVDLCAKDMLLYELGYKRQGNQWIHPAKRPIFELDFYPTEVSSTKLREEGVESVKGKLDPYVYDYIKRHKLYR